ncbi:thiopurine S-methyltransferase [Thalassococcus sp. BH17M4-6]|uniref:thiopurine S-methyltransferase n=1 Tax=Thalassococcus sp. BH17M4-6 TaxID=3413148 RepID=UPI003BC5B216
MDAGFWHQRWQENQIGFHERSGNAAMVAHWDALGLGQGARVFVPLCGKTRDIAWLLARGHRVVGAELSRLAVEQLFEDLGATPEITSQGSLDRFGAPGIDIFVGDIFDLGADLLGAVDATYDRAALIALPPDMRSRYAPHLHRITGGAPQLLICLEYDQGLMDGPPFSVDAAEVARVYGAHYDIRKLWSDALAEGLKGRVPATESIWHLT